MDEERKREKRQLVEEILETIEKREDPNFVPPPPRKVVRRSRIMDFLGNFISTDSGSKNTVSDKDFMFPQAIRSMLDEIYFDVMKEETVLTSFIHQAQRGVVFKYAVTIVHPCSASTEILDKAWAVMGIADIDIQAGGDSSIVVTHTISLDDNTRKAITKDKEGALVARRVVRLSQMKQALATKGQTGQLEPTNEADVLYEVVQSNVDIVSEKQQLSLTKISGRSMMACWPLKIGASVSYKQLATIRDQHWVDSVVVGNKPGLGVCLFITFTK